METTSDPVCTECGKTMTVSEENFSYDACGIPNIVLKNVTVRACEECSRKEYMFDPDEADRNVAEYLIRKQERLTVEEGRFLFTYALNHMEGFPYYGQVGEV